jgi:hypothetical protein
VSAFALVRKWLCFSLLLPGLQATAFQAQSAPRWQVDLTQFGYAQPTNRVGDLRSTFFGFADETQLAFAADRLIACFEMPRGLVRRKPRADEAPRARCIFLDPQTGATIMQRDFEIGGEPYLWSARDNFLLRGPGRLTLYSAQAEILWSLPFPSGRVEVAATGSTLLVAPGMPPRAGGGVQEVRAFNLPGLEPRGTLRIPAAVQVCVLDDAIVFSVARGSGIYAIQVWPMPPVGATAPLKKEENGNNDLQRNAPRMVQEGAGHWQQLASVSGAALVSNLQMGDKPELGLFSADGRELAHRKLRRSMRLDYVSSAAGNIFAVSRAAADWDSQKPQDQTITLFDLQLRQRFELKIKPLPPAMAIAGLSGDGTGLVVWQGESLRMYDVPQSSPRQ